MKWVRARHATREIFGTLEGDRLLVHGGDMFAAAAPTGESLAVAELAFLPPVRPRKFIGLWNNFHAAAAKNGWTIPAEPLYFLKADNALAAHQSEIAMPGDDIGRIFYEGELGIVIGKTAKAATPEQAAAAIFGYTCVNDVTAFELLTRDASFAQWTRAKSFDGFGPIGPAVATGLDAQALVVRTRVNGRERQNYPVADMIFSPVSLVERISRDMTLEPGDVIACGTSLGALPVKAGTLVEVEIDGIGVLANRFV
ncbi:MAG: fumarylacetoacetate hydrolase family protein [Telmatospirillum sp.]|nr:fumarylacetoacetate hydrolase family protein [Telmatospirillum sp.]